MAARVFLVENEAEVGDLVVAALSSEGYEVVVVPSGEECLRLTQTEHVDLICLEVDLPGMDGFEVADQLQRKPTTEDIPFIFLTSRRTLHDRVRGLRLGAHAYLAKPFAFPELFATVEGILKRTQRRLAALGVVGLMGSLSDVGIPAVIQAIEHEQRSGVLNVASGEKWGRVAFLQGGIVAAEAGRAEGEEAIWEMVRWHDGSYAFRPQRVDPQPLLAGSATSILVRAYQQYDERRGEAVEDDGAGLSGPRFQVPG